MKDPVRLIEIIMDTKLIVKRQILEESVQKIQNIIIFKIGIVYNMDQTMIAKDKHVHL